MKPFLVPAVIFSISLLVVFFLLAHQSSNVWSESVTITTHQDSSQGKDTATVPNDQLLGGLLSPNFDEELCVSRYQSMLFRKASPYILSSYLISKLRAYEALHKKCAPNTPLFQKSMQQLMLNHSTDQLECNYVLWSPYGGMGNRMLTLVSTFLYALLTNRVMLVQRSANMNNLFCEPFPESTWYIPFDFPLMKKFGGFNINYNQSYGYMAAHNLIIDEPESPPTALPSFIYLHLQFDYGRKDLHKRIFCEGDQEVINKINWVLIKANKYFVPGLFMIQKYGPELHRMFPLKETVFHHLGRYLLHPSNSVWGMVMRYYNSYQLGNADEIVGIQARIFNWAPISIDDMYKQIVACTQEELILPKIYPDKKPEGSLSALNKTTSRAVLVVSLYEELFEKLKDLYYHHTTTTGDLISVYQPSHEETQKSEQLHNQKALAEILLLSLSDVLVITGSSTFGYISTSLAGIKPWFLSHGKKVPNPACFSGLTIDPCMHQPANFECKNGIKFDFRKSIRHVRRCEDSYQGVKLFD